MRAIENIQRNQNKKILRKKKFKIIKFVLIKIFQSRTPELVRFLIDPKTILFSNLKFSDLENNIKHGYIFNIVL